MRNIACITCGTNISTQARNILLLRALIEVTVRVLGDQFWGHTMWQGLRNRFYSAMYYLGKAPPTSAEITAEFDKFEQRILPSDDDPLCDCQVIVGGVTIECQTRRTSVCEALGEAKPGVNTVPHKVGYCRSAR